MVFRKGRYVGELGKQIITMGFVSLFYGGIPLIFENNGDGERRQRRHADAQQ